MKDDYYYPRLAGALQSKLECLPYNSELYDLLKNREDWRKVKTICARLVAEALEIAEDLSESED